MQVFNACVLAVLYYGLEEVTLIKALCQWLDYFHTKALRNILRIEAAYLSKVSNKEVINRANEILYGRIIDPENCAESYNGGRKYLIASKQIRVSAVTVLGHIIRTDSPLDHMKRVTVNADLSKFWRGKRRVGRPRFSWLETTMEKAYLWRRKKKHLTKKSFSIRNAQHRKEILRAATSRAFPFNKKKAHKWKKRKTKCQYKKESEAEAGAHPKAEPRPSLGRASAKPRPSLGLAWALQGPSLGQASAEPMPSRGQASAKPRPVQGRARPRLGPA